MREDAPGCYHLVSRCVRRLRCLDGERKLWVEGSLRYHSGKMAVDVLTYAVMANHIHVVVRIRPDQAAEWSAKDVVDRWLDLVPPRDCFGVAVMGIDEVQKERLAQDEGWVRERRSRLCSMSWFMRLVKQKLARRINKADGASGHLWDDRFFSVPLPDQGAILACMVYVDLNPFRSGLCDLPEQGECVGLAVRLRRMNVFNDDNLYGAGSSLKKMGRRGGVWVVPIVGCGVYWQMARGDWAYKEPGALEENDYLRLLDYSARLLRSGKKSLGQEVDDIFERIGVDGGQWLEALHYP